MNYSPTIAKKKPIVNNIAMPCIEELPDKENAQMHVDNQRAVIQNLRGRMGELISASPEPGSVEYAALVKLKRDLDGEEPISEGSLIFNQILGQGTAEDRAEVMARLYTQRSSYRFRDTSKGDERIANLHGYPMVDELLEAGEQDIAEEIIARAASSLTERKSSNPVDFIDTSGLEVKDALANSIEHHHIYNNVYLNSEGRVQFKSFKVYVDSNGNPVLSIIPSYWNAKERGRVNQFVGLLDAMHSGNDAAAHLHYYKFKDHEMSEIEAKIRSDFPEDIDAAKRRTSKLRAELQRLEAQKQDPQKYFSGLESGVESARALVVQTKAGVKGFAAKAKSSLSPEQLEKRELWDAAKKQLKALEKDLAQATLLREGRQRLEDVNKQVSDLLIEAKKINLARIPKAERSEAKERRNAITQQVASLKAEAKNLAIDLRKNRSIDSLISETRSKLQGAEAIAALTPEKIVEMLNEQNGFFSFDKGSPEKNDHRKYLQPMNKEIQKLYVRQAIDHYKSQGLDPVTEIQALIETRLRNTFLERYDHFVGRLQSSLLTSP